MILTVVCSKELCSAALDTPFVFKSALLGLRIEIVVLADGGGFAPVDLIHGTALLEGEGVTVRKPDADL